MTRRNIGTLAFMAIATIALTGCGDRGIATGAYKDSISASVFMLKSDGTFSMTNLLECKEIVNGTYTVSGHKLRFELSGGESSNNPMYGVLKDALAGEIDEGGDSFSVQGLSYTRATADTDTPIPCSPTSTSADAGNTVSPAAPVAPSPEPAPTVDTSAPAPAAPPTLVQGPKPSGQGSALGLYAQDGTFVPGEYDAHGQFVPGVRRPNGMFIAGRFAGREFVPDTVASGSGFLPSSP